MIASEARVHDVGEFGLIARLAARLLPSARAAGDVALGIGDDAALWQPSPGMAVVITTDALIELVHFRLDWTDWASLGHKLLAVNVSDIAAMGAQPRVATVVLGLTGNERVGDLESFYDGLGGLAAAHGIVIAGGDVVRAPNDVTLSLTLLGEVAPDQAITRAGAAPGDLVVVSGTLGASAGGLALLETRRDLGATGPLLVAAHLRPNPRVALGRILFDHGVTSAMDLSDGLLGDLPKMLEASQVSARVDVELIPVLPAVRAMFPTEAERLALRGGEDFELLMTVPETSFSALAKAAQAIGATLTPIGEILTMSREPELMLSRHGQSIDGGSGAFDHFGPRYF